MPDFDEFVADRSATLVRAAWLLTGNEATAHDLVQAALERTWQRWGGLREPAAAEAYVRKVMVTTLTSWRRRRSFGERPVAEVADVATGDDDAALRHSVASALRALPAGQRAVVVLRYFCDLSEADTAAALGCTTGTVKSQAARALARLRESPLLAGVWDEEVTG